MDAQLKRASQSYCEKGSCTQAVLDAFGAEAAMHPPRQRRELCGVLCAAEDILQLSADQAFRQVLERFRAEYGGVTCEEILQSTAPTHRCCCMKVKDAVLLIHHALEQTEGENP